MVFLTKIFKLQKPPYQLCCAKDRKGFFTEKMSCFFLCSDQASPFQQISIHDPAMIMAGGGAAGDDVFANLIKRP